MAEIYPEGDDHALVAQELLNIVGPDRAIEVRTGSMPLHFVVPEDVAVEYQRRVAERTSLSQPPEPTEEPKVETAAKTTPTRATSSTKTGK